MTGQIQNGKFIPANLEIFNALLRKHEGKEVEVTITRPKRSNEQNRLYWGVVLYYIAQHTGYTENELHELFKQKYCPKKIIKIAGQNTEVPRSTAELTTDEFTRYINDIVFFGQQELQINFPL